MKVCRFGVAGERARVGLIDGEDVIDLSGAGVEGLSVLLEADNCLERLGELRRGNLPRRALSSVKVLCPVENQEVWAAGVTYLRSKKARMEESDFSATAYDRVYEAARPELFFKSMPHKVVGPNEAVGIRRDSRWNVPEPELAFVLNSKGRIAGFTIGNDMSSRDIEGENLLYLPQAKIYKNSCAIGPFITVGTAESEARTWKITVQIQRGGQEMFRGETSVAQLKRPFDELAKYVFASQEFPSGVVLLTGTGIVPPDNFTLAEADVVRIEISGIGVLTNPVRIV